MEKMAQAKMQTDSKKVCIRLVARYMQEEEELMPMETMVRLVIEVPLTLKQKFLEKVRTKGSSMTFVLSEFLKEYIQKK